MSVILGMLGPKIDELLQSLSRIADAGERTATAVESMVIQKQEAVEPPQTESLQDLDIFSSLDSLETSNTETNS